ncbi:hypothetical protein [Zooshikella sp. RANM57]|uniref:hypothetical protein n=1 Tax=Zooshikella sp. RANM57 TaxID=3425863 RepID=UPI003D6F857B
MSFLVSTLSLLLTFISACLAVLFFPKYFERLSTELKSILLSEKYLVKGCIILTATAAMTSVIVLSLSEPRFLAAVLMTVISGSFVVFGAYLMPLLFNQHERLTCGHYVSQQQLQQTQLLCTVVLGGASTLGLLTFLVI